MGVEFSVELHSTTVRNIDRFNGTSQRCFRISSLHMDAARYRFEPANTVLFLYNPFGEPVMTEVLGNIKRDNTEQNYDFYIIYCNPTLSKLFDQQDMFETIDTVPGIDFYRLRR